MSLPQALPSRDHFFSQPDQRLWQRYSMPPAAVDAPTLSASASSWMHLPVVPATAPPVTPGSQPDLATLAETTRGAHSHLA